MTGDCSSAQGVGCPLCAVKGMGGWKSRRLARRLSTAAASLLPGVVLVLLPKCPLCLAAWLTVLTGVAFPAVGTAWVRGMLAVFWLTAGALAVAPMVRRRAFGGVSPICVDDGLDTVAIGPLRREVAGDIEDELGGTGGVSVNFAVHGGHDSHVGSDCAIQCIERGNERL